MEIEKYREQLKEIESNFENAKNELMLAFAKSNNHHKVGDIIKDHTSIIKIDKIQYLRGYGNELPSCAYMGYKLKKDLTPRKDFSRDKIYQINIIK